MNIASGAAISAIQSTQLRQNIAANDVANINTPGYEQVTPRQADMLPAGTTVSSASRTPNSGNPLSSTDLATEMVEVNTNKTTYSANLAVIKAQDRMTGELIDLLA